MEISPEKVQVLSKYFPLGKLSIGKSKSNENLREYTKEKKVFLSNELSYWRSTNIRLVRTSWTLPNFKLCALQKYYLYTGWTSIIGTSITVNSQ